MFTRVTMVSAIALTCALGAFAQTTPPAAPADPARPALTKPFEMGADASKLIGRNVKNSEGETIGEIKSVHIGADGKVDQVIVGVGGFLGMGEREVAIAWKDLTILDDGERVLANMSKDQLKTMAEYKYSDPTWRGRVFTDRGPYAPSTAAPGSPPPPATMPPRTADRGTLPPADRAAPMPATGADAGKLIGRNIKNTQNETIGEIKSVFIGTDGKVEQVMVGVGGFLGIGEREVAIAWKDLTITDNGEKVTVNMSKDQLKAMPEYRYTDPTWRGRVFTDRGPYSPPTTTMTQRAPTDRTVTPPPATTERLPADRTERLPADRKVPERVGAAFNVTGEMSGEAIIGASVRNSANELIGTINDIYLDNNGAVKTVIVSVGGFLGLGSHDVALPWSDLQFKRDGTALMVSTPATKEALKALPAFKREQAQAPR